MGEEQAGGVVLSVGAVRSDDAGAVVCVSARAVEVCQSPRWAQYLGHHRHFAVLSEGDVRRTTRPRSEIPRRSGLTTSSVVVLEESPCPREFSRTNLQQPVGCVAQWLERRSLTGELSLASARSAADV